MCPEGMLQWCVWFSRWYPNSGGGGGGGGGGVEGDSFIWPNSRCVQLNKVWF